MKTKLIKLKFISPFHLNPARDTLEKTETVIQSDMLVSALATCHTRLYGTFCHEFFSDKLRISSLFPYYKEALFFPAPMFDCFAGEIPQKETKKIRKIRFLEHPLWNKVMAGERLKKEEFEVAGSFAVIPGKEKEEDISEFFMEEEVQRLGQDPFYFSQVKLKEEGGLFFLFKTAPEIEEQFKASLRLLGDEGIGGDRTVGKGLFEIRGEVSDFELPDIDSPHLVSLSFFIPTADDFKNIDFKESFYNIQHKKGWHITHKVLSLKKRGIFGFSEGSVFKSSRAPVGKKITLLKKEEMSFKTASPFDVLRSGFFLGCRGKVPD